eukprot:963313_1
MAAGGPFPLTALTTLTGSHCYAEALGRMTAGGPFPLTAFAAFDESHCDDDDEFLLVAGLGRMVAGRRRLNESGHHWPNYVHRGVGCL